MNNDDSFLVTTYEALSNTYNNNNNNFIVQARKTSQKIQATTVRLQYRAKYTTKLIHKQFIRIPSPSPISCSFLFLNMQLCACRTALTHLTTQHWQWHKHKTAIKLLLDFTGLIPRTLGPFNVFILLNGWTCLHGVLD